MIKNIREDLRGTGNGRKENKEIREEYCKL